MCVAIIAAVAIPTAAMAAVGTFTSTTATPAVTATNSATVANAKGVQGTASATSAGVTRYGVTGNGGGTFGVGVQGTGTKYGVFSNGPLGIVSGKSLSCVTTCLPGGLLAAGSVTAGKLGAGSVTSGNLAAASVGSSALAASAKATQPLASGESESGVFGAAGGNSTGGVIIASINFVRPLTGPGGILAANIIDTGAAANANCPFFGSASPGYLCLYPQNRNGVTSGFVTTTNYVGANFWWNVGPGGNSSVEGYYTVTAP